MNTMTSFTSDKELISDILRVISDGKTQLPDFQRGWVWDDDHIKSLLASPTSGVTRSGNLVSNWPWSPVSNSNWCGSTISNRGGLTHASSPSLPSQHRGKKTYDLVKRLGEDGFPPDAQDNFALLDLASMICRPKNPECTKCPLLEHSIFGQNYIRTLGEI